MRHCEGSVVRNFEGSNFRYTHTHRNEYEQRKMHIEDAFYFKDVNNITTSDMELRTKEFRWEIGLQFGLG